MDRLILGRWSVQYRLRKALVVLISDDPVGKQRASRSCGCRNCCRDVRYGSSSRGLARRRRTRERLVEVGRQKCEIGGIDDGVVIEIALGEITVLPKRAGE